MTTNSQTGQWFDPHKSFIDLGIVRVFIIIILIISSITAAIIYFNSKPEIDLTYKGFNNAVTMFSVPLSILAILIPIIAILATNHRSEQTKEQIRITSEQNTFSNYYKHMDEFVKHCEAMSEKEGNGLAISKPRSLYKILFPEAGLGNLKVSTSSSICKDYALMFFKISTGFTDYNEFRNSVTKLDDLSLEFSAQLFIENQSNLERRQAVNYKEMNVLLFHQNTKYMIRSHIRPLHFINSIMEFDVDYKADKSVAALLSLNIEEIPTPCIQNGEYIPFSCKEIARVADV